MVQEPLYSEDVDTYSSGQNPFDGNLDMYSYVMDVVVPVVVLPLLLAIFSLLFGILNIVYRLVPKACFDFCCCIVCMVGACIGPIYYCWLRKLPMFKEGSGIYSKEEIRNSKLLIYAATLAMWVCVIVGGTGNTRVANGISGIFDTMTTTIDSLADQLQATVDVMTEFQGVGMETQCSDPSGYNMTKDASYSVNITSMGDVTSQLLALKPFVEDFKTTVLNYDAIRARIIVSALTACAIVVSASALGAITTIGTLAYIVMVVIFVPLVLVWVACSAHGVFVIMIAEMCGLLKNNNFGDLKTLVPCPDISGIKATMDAVYESMHMSLDFYSTSCSTGPNDALQAKMTDATALIDKMSDCGILQDIWTGVIGSICYDFLGGLGLIYRSMYAQGVIMILATIFSIRGYKRFGAKMVATEDEDAWEGEVKKEGGVEMVEPVAVVEVSPEQPGYQQPVAVQPVAVEPVYQQPVAVEPVYQQPVAVEPVYQQPVAVEPVTVPEEAPPAYS